MNPSLAGLLCLAAALGIGRFAFTPILPMMGISVEAGGWLATANYVGYLAGALAAVTMRWPPAVAIRTGIVTVAVTTLAMAATEAFAAGLALRFLAGLASAWVLVNVSTLGARRPDVVFSGVGVGMCVAGLACLALIVAGASAANAWLALGCIAAIIAAATWGLGKEASPQPQAGSSRKEGHWPLVACYGAFGFGYIIPATFLPAMAKHALADPIAFGLVWPVFGAAAAASTLLAGLARKRWGDRRVWIGCHVLMAAGVAILLFPGISAAIAMTLCAILVGGTFMVATMTGIQEARRIAGAGARPLIAAMTAAFAAGQIAGPLLVSLVHDVPLSLTFSALVMLASAFALWRIP